MRIAPAGVGAGSSEESGAGCFGAFLLRRGLRLWGLTSGAPAAAGGAGGAAAATGRGAGGGAAAAGGSGCALKEKLECLLLRATQTIVPLSPSSEMSDEETSPEAVVRQRWIRASRAESAAGLVGAEGGDSGGFASGAGGEGSRAEVANRPPSRDVMCRRGSCCCGGAVAWRLDALFAESGDGAAEAEEMRETSAEDEAAAEDMNCSGGMRDGAATRRVGWLPKTTVRVEESPRVAGSTARALAADPEGRDECCAVMPGSRDLGPFESMNVNVEFASRKYTRRSESEGVVESKADGQRRAKW
jgi:hypothetical protein